MNIIEEIVYWEKWIPDRYKGTSFFGRYDLWHYFDTGDEHSECETCQRYHGFDFAGDQLRQNFPDLEIITDDMIAPNVHQTLWGTDSCKCFLIRVTDNPDYADPTKSVVYFGPKIEPYTPKDEPKPMDWNDPHLWGDSE